MAVQIHSRHLVLQPAAKATECKRTSCECVKSEQKRMQCAHASLLAPDDIAREEQRQRCGVRCIGGEVVGNGRGGISLFRQQSEERKARRKEESKEESKEGGRREKRMIKEKKRHVQGSETDASDTHDSLQRVQGAQEGVCVCVCVCASGVSVKNTDSRVHYKPA